MLVGHEVPDDLSVAISGSGASIDTDDSVLFDGHPASPTRMTWLSGAQTTASELDLTITWTTAIKPRILAILGPTLPVGTLVSCRFDSGGATYDLDPGGNSDQRIMLLPRGRRAVWMVFPQPAAAITGLQLQFFNDVDGAASIAASSEFEIGEIAVMPAVELVLARGWDVSTVDPSKHRRSRGQQLHTSRRLAYDRLAGRLVPTYVDEVKQQALDNGMDWELLLAALEGGARGACIPRWADAGGNVDPDRLHRNAYYGSCVDLPKITHTAGDWFEGPWTWEGIPW